MEIAELKDLDEKLLEHFLTETGVEKSIFSQLASSQTNNDRTVSRERIEYIRASKEHLMFLAVEDEQLLGMALAQKVTGINNAYMYVHDIVVAPNTRGKGVGSGLMEALMAAGEKAWPEIVRMQLTSRPSRGTGPFFQKFGFRPRTKESGDETIVYVKDVGDYSS